MAELVVAALISTAISVGVSYIASAIAGPTKLGDVVGSRLETLQVQTSLYGNFVRVVYGKTRLAGNVIWAQDIEEEEVTETQSSGGKGGSPKTEQKTVTYNYFVDMAIALCEGEIDGVLRIWADGVPLDLTLGTYRIYLGTETQNPDSYIESIEGIGNTPAYRGLAYVVVENFPLNNFGGRIPNFNFEVMRTVKSVDTIEDKIKEIVLIPGSGEFVYDTVIQTKTTGAEDDNGTFWPDGLGTAINSHNFDGGSNVITALNDLQRDLPNIETIAVVVNWFTDTVEANDCVFVPKTEFGSSGATTTPNSWSVGSWTRDNATVINFFGDGTPSYGGTPSDQSLVRLVKYINVTLGLNVMLYPMPLVDIVDSSNPKPWRGRITTAESSGADTRLNNMFTKTNGYNDFIMHYVDLNITEGRLMDYVDSIVMGSEMVGITQVHWPAASGTFPAVSKFITLAGTIQAALTLQGNGSVNVVYAADWSEYHSIDGWFNMDPLWVHADLDIIGIDYYMPITPVLPQSQITKATITSSFESDEGWEYFYTDSFNKTGKTFYSPSDGTSPFAWKNIENWWGVANHVNPDSSDVWTSKAKPIWITEYGFPSVDAAANMPNVFYDPRSIENFFPVGSQGTIDFPAQRTAIDSFVDYWDAITLETGNTNLVSRKFLWTWDARPYPFWPWLTDVWADGELWEPGHWIQGKLGVSTLGAVIADLLQKVGFASSEYNVGELSDLVFGFSLSGKRSARAHIEMLQLAYHFDAVESAGVLTFKSRRNKSSVLTITEDELVVQTQEHPMSITRQQQLELPTYVDVSFIDINRDYQVGSQVTQRQTIQSDNSISIVLEIVFGDQFAKQIADTNMYTSWVERVGYKFRLPPKYARVEPTDIITVDLDGTLNEIRVVETRLEQGGTQEVIAIAHDVSAFNFNQPPQTGLTSTIVQNKLISDTDLEFLDLPALPTDTGVQGYLRMAAIGKAGTSWEGTVIYRSDDGGVAGGNTFSVITIINSHSTIGVVLDLMGSGPTSGWDNGTTIDVLVQTGTLSSVSELAVLNGANVAVIGSEIIQFQTATLTATNRYTLSKLLRGRRGTERFASTHSIADRFVLLDGAVAKLGMPLELRGQERFYKPVSVGNTLATTTEEAFTYTGESLKPWSPVQAVGVHEDNADWTITWIRRTRLGGEWLDEVDVPLSEETELYEIDVMDGVTVLNTYTSTSQSLIYTIAQQEADAGVQDPLEINIYQMSAIVGRGHVLNAILTSEQYVSDDYVDVNYI